MNKPKVRLHAFGYGPNYDGEWYAHLSRFDADMLYLEHNIKLWSILIKIGISRKVEQNGNSTRTAAAN